VIPFFLSQFNLARCQAATGGANANKTLEGYPTVSYMDKQTAELQLCGTIPSCSPWMAKKVEHATPEGVWS
jgi:hypothetical protein